MPSDPAFERTRRFAAAEVKRVLGIPEPTTDRLFAKARTVLGPERTTQCLELAREAPLSRRWVPTSAVASLTAGTLDLGPEWWSRNHLELGGDLQWASCGTPDALLDGGRGDGGDEDGASCLATLARWIADDAADKAWGKPVDRVDMSDPRVDGRVAVLAGARAGDRLTAIFAPGGRIWVDVVDLGAHTSHEAARRAGGKARLGTRLAERRLHEVAQVGSAWAMSAGLGTVRLPGETPGRASDPFADRLDADSSRRLFDWARSHGAGAQELTGPWRTKDALWTARHRLGLPYTRPGAWITFDDAVAAAIDGREKALMEALIALDA
jgi:hypothetical protein